MCLSRHGVAAFLPLTRQSPYCQNSTCVCPMKMDDSVGWMLNDGEEESRGGEGTVDGERKIQRKPKGKGCRQKEEEKVMKD